MKNKDLIKAVVITSASFAGYNIGSGFATGTEALQFFASWGAGKAFVSVLIATLFAMVSLLAVYATGFDEKFADNKQIYKYFFGSRLGFVFEIYIYGSMLIMVLAMMSGAGATINQHFGIPTYVGAVCMGAICIITSLLRLEKLRDLLGYFCIVIIVFVLAFAVYVMIKAGFHMGTAGANVENYVSEGSIYRISVMGLTHPLVSGLASAGLLINSGFAWAAIMGKMCRSHKEAVWTGVFSSVFFYGTTMIVVYLLLISMDHIAGQEVPLLAVVQHYLPLLSLVYSCIIILAIFSTITGRLSLLSKHYGKDNKKLSLSISIGITVLAVGGSLFVSFSRLSNLMFAFCGAVGILMIFIVVVKYARARFSNRKNRYSGNA